MCRNQRQRGFALISAIFILVVLAALAGFIATVSTTQHAGSAIDIQSARAYQAARAGIEWGLFQTKVAAWCAATPTSDIGPFNGMAVTVTCATVAGGNAVEAGLGSLYRITATACAPPAGSTCPGAAATPAYVERRLSALVERP